MLVFLFNFGILLFFLEEGIKVPFCCFHVDCSREIRLEDYPKL